MKRPPNHPKSLNPHGAEQAAKENDSLVRSKRVRLATADRSTGRTREELVKLIDEREAARTAKEASYQLAPRGTAAALVASPEYQAIAEASVVADIERRKARSLEKTRMRAWRKKHGTAVRALLIEAFKIPTLLALPAPDNITRKFDDPWRYPPQSFDAQIDRGSRRPDGYRPQWVIDAEQTVNIRPSDFQHVRQVALSMTREQCATFLRVGTLNVARWEEGVEQIPFAAYWLLVTICRGQMFKHLRPEWEGWRIIEAGPDAGKLLDPLSRKCYSAHEVANIPRQWGEIFRLEQQNRSLQARLAEVEAENIRLRQQFVSQGITDELRAMHTRLSVMLDEIGTAQVVDFPQTTATEQLKRAFK